MLLRALRFAKYIMRDVRLL